jgi:hypothetical protein
MKKTIALLSFFVLALPLLAQVKVTRVNDRRTSGKFFAELSISMELPKVRSVDVAASRVLVSSAVDDTGKTLVDPEKDEPGLDPNHNLSTQGNNALPATVSLTLLNPDRKAKTVKEVRGEVELYMPSKDPNSTADIPKFLSLTGKPLTHKALKANGIEITILSQAQIDAEKKRMGDEKRIELAGYGYTGEDLENSVKSDLEYRLRLDEGELLVRLKDPNKRIQKIEYIAGTEERNVSAMEDEGFVKFSTWGDKPQPDWGLRISMKTAKNTVRQPFTLKDVALP